MLQLCFISPLSGSVVNRESCTTSFIVTFANYIYLYHISNKHKSNIVLDVKPWDDETDIKEIERCVRTVDCHGLL